MEGRRDEAKQETRVRIRERRGEESEWKVEAGKCTDSEEIVKEGREERRKGRKEKKIDGLIAFKISGKKRVWQLNRENNKKKVLMMAIHQHQHTYTHTHIYIYKPPPSPSVESDVPVVSV